MSSTICSRRSTVYPKSASSIPSTTPKTLPEIAATAGLAVPPSAKFSIADSGLSLYLGSKVFIPPRSALYELFGDAFARHAAKSVRFHAADGATCDADAAPHHYGCGHHRHGDYRHSLLVHLQEGG